MRRLHAVNVALFSILLISLGVMVLLVYTDSDSTFGIVTVVGCLVYLFLYLVYLAIFALMKTLKMERSEKKLRFFKVLAWFGALSVIDIATSYLISSEVHAYNFFVTFGIAVGITFFDVMFFKQRRYS
ncbi:hypothetical protein IQ283_04200 [Alkalihalobacillus hwajinpoensis]|uniref:hypothetical protein n=1 Tax=Guptibacillus hwajinpoensis TaxID=208199 RepID=UPI0018847559|nr:hypothetical protein [Pseudalkalibacillus hwajinpoensis]MBF0705798.1 hypothetical protein [Pseudalkalibacillus hwajinpoensis]